MRHPTPTMAANPKIPDLLLEDDSEPEVLQNYCMPVKSCPFLYCDSLYTKDKTSWAYDISIP